MTVYLIIARMIVFLLRYLQEKGYDFYQYGGIRITKNEEIEEPAFHAKGMTKRDKF